MKFRQLDSNAVRSALHWKDPLCYHPTHPEEAERPADRIPLCAVTIWPFIPTHWWQAELLRNSCYSSQKPKTHWSQKAVNGQRVPGLFEVNFMQWKIRQCKLCTKTKHQILDSGMQREQVQNQNFTVSKAILNLFFFVHLAERSLFCCLRSHTYKKWWISNCFFRSIGSCNLRLFSWSKKHTGCNLYLYCL